MARVVLHVGAHKTATSFVQGSFHLNREMLEARGIFYPDMPPQRAQHALARPWIDLAIDTGPDPVGPDQRWEALIRAYAGREGVLFLSSESFSCLYPKRVDMADLARRLQSFDSVQLVYTLRQQTELLTSIWLELAKGRELPPPFETYLERLLKQGVAGGLALDHGLFYDHLLTGFAPEQIHLLDYETISQGEGGVLGAFLRLLGSDLDPARLRPVPRDLANISPDPLALWLATRIWPSEVPDPERVARIRAALGPKQLRSSLLSQSERAKVAAHFAPLNAALAARVQPWQPGFALRGAPAAKPLLSRDMVDDALWAQIAAALYAAPPPRAPARFSLVRLRPRLKRLLS